MEGKFFRLALRELSQLFARDTTGIRDLCMEVVNLWQHWPTLRAFYAWYEVTMTQQHLRRVARLALQQLYVRLASQTFRALAVQVDWRTRKHQASLLRTLNMHKKAFYSWQNGAHVCQQRRDKLHAAVRLYTGKTVRAAFFGWVHHQHYKQYWKLKLTSFQTAGRTTTTRRCFQDWRAVVEYILPLKRKVAFMIGEGKRKLQQGALQTWQKSARRQRWVNIALARWRNHLLTGALHTWHNRASWLSYQRSLMKVSLSHWSHLPVSSTWAQWCCFVDQQRQNKLLMQRVILYITQHHLVAAWNGWKEGVAYHSEAMAAVRQCLLRWRKLLVARALTKWLACWEESRFRDEHADLLTAARQQQLCRKLMVVWHASASMTAHRKAIGKLISARRHLTLARGCLAVWETWAQDRRKVRQALILYWNTMLVRSFKAWLNFHEQKKMERAAEMNRQLRLARCWQEWKYHFRYRQHLRWCEEHLSSLRHPRLKLQSLQAWRWFCGWQQVLHQAETMSVLVRQRKALLWWLQAAKEKRQDRLRVDHLIATLANKHAAAVLNDWYKLIKAHQCHRLTVWRRGLRGWQVVSAENAPWRHHLRYARGVLALQCLRRCLSSWRAHAWERASKHQAYIQQQMHIQQVVAFTDHITTRHATQLKHQALLLWHKQVRVRCNVVQHILHQYQSSVQRCLHCWAQLVVQHKAAQQKAVAVCDRHSKQRVLVHWQQTTALLQKQRSHIEQRTLAIVSRRRCVAITRHWRQVINEEKEKQWRYGEVVLMMGQKRRKTLLWSVLWVWNQQMELHRQHQALILNFAREKRMKIVRCFFVSWRDYSLAMSEPQAQPGTHRDGQDPLGTPRVPTYSLSPILPGPCSPSRPPLYDQGHIQPFRLVMSHVAPSTITNAGRGAPRCSAPSIASKRPTSQVFSQPHMAPPPPVVPKSVMKLAHLSTATPKSMEEEDDEDIVQYKTPLPPRRTSRYPITPGPSSWTPPPTSTSGPLPVNISLHQGWGNEYSDQVDLTWRQ